MTTYARIRGVKAPQTKKELITAIRDCKEVTLVEMKPWGSEYHILGTKSGQFVISGPEGKPHKWYAQINVSGNKITAK